MKLLAKVGPILFVAIATMVNTEASLPQTPSDTDQRLNGVWLNQNNGNSVVFNRGSDVFVILSGQYAIFSGRGSVSRCIEHGGNLCLELPLMKCSFRYLFSGGGVLTLQFMGGLAECRQLQGAYHHED